MKHTIKRMLAILIALLLAMPTVSFAEMPLDVPVVDNAFIEDEALSALEIDPAMDGAGVLPLLDPSEALNGDLTLADALQPEAGPAVTYRFIVDNAPVAAQEAWEGDAIQRPADPEAPEGYAFEGWFLKDGTRLFADVDGAYRVRNVMIWGEPLEMDRIYTLASQDFTLINHGDGQTAFDGARTIWQADVPDYGVVAEYLHEDLDGIVGEDYANPYGQGCIVAVG